jgi:hypothetical protein
MAKKKKVDRIEQEVERLERLYRETGDVRYHLRAKMQSGGGPRAEVTPTKGKRRK